MNRRKCVYSRACNGRARHVHRTVLFFSLIHRPRCSLHSSLIMQERRKANVRQSTSKVPDKISTPPLSPPSQRLPVNNEVLDALYNIKTTPFGHSFLSRLHGFRGFVPPGLVAVDWETRTPWMNVMADIREHYLFAQSV